MTLLEVQDLRTHFSTPNGVARAVDGVSFKLSEGETLAIVGESGCGKTVLATSLMRLFRTSSVSHPTGEVIFERRNLLTMPSHEMEQIRGRKMAMIFQEPMTALNPVWDIRSQIAEPILKHLGGTKDASFKRALELLEALGVPAPDRVMQTYPHTLSGGMRQRVAIAIALACKPSVLIADEPTTALDVTVQAQILQLIRDMQKELGMGVILITHDLGVVNEIADRVLVMYSGRVAETGRTEDVLFDSKHPYTQRLVASVPRIEKNSEKFEHLETIEGQVRSATKFAEGCRFAERCLHASGVCLSETPPALLQVSSHSTESRPLSNAVACYLYDKESGVVKKEKININSSTVEKLAIGQESTILEISNLKTWFPVQKGLLRRHVGDIKAVDDISITITQGETLAVVGESGCGKSTFGQTLLRLVEATGGQAILTDALKVDILSTNRQGMMDVRRQIQIIFQDPYGSLNPRYSVREIIEEGLKIHFPKMDANQRDNEIGDILEEVGLPRDARFRYPHEFSGGQRQRVAIARALILKPKILILDEATSALDVSIQAQVLNLLKSLQAKYKMTFIFITHNLGVVRQIADRVAVMYLGKIVEIGSVEDVMFKPKHPYTEKLISSVPKLKRGAKLPEPLLGDVPSPVNPPSGCAFHPRCPKRRELTDTTQTSTMGKCPTILPELTRDESSNRGRQVRCHYPLKPFD